MKLFSLSTASVCSAPLRVCPEICVNEEEEISAISNTLCVKAFISLSSHLVDSILKFRVTMMSVYNRKDVPAANACKTIHTLRHLHSLRNNNNKENLSWN